MPDPAWPPLPYSAWSDTLDTLQRYTQMVGKVRMALSPPEPEFANVSLYVTSRGLTTMPMPCGDQTLQIDVDLIAHKVILTTSDGDIRSIALSPRSVADFYDEFTALLAQLKITVAISPIPQEVADLTPFDKDTKHASYDSESVQRFFQVLSRSDIALKRHRAWFRGRHTPVHFFWGGFDLCYDRFSGRPATPPPSSNRLYRLSMDVEQIYAGFWPGSQLLPETAFASYVYPKPAGFEESTVRPGFASWNDQLREFVLRYEDVRASSSPDETLMEFFSSTYEAAATLAGWDRALVE